MACKHPSMSTFDDHIMKMRGGSGAVHQNAFIVLTHSFLPCTVEQAVKPLRSPCCSSRLTELPQQAPHAGMMCKCQQGNQASSMHVCRDGLSFLKAHCRKTLPPLFRRLVIRQDLVLSSHPSKPFAPTEHA